jgi:hypothetical protein
LEEFVDDYYSVEKFRDAYKRVVVPLGDKYFCGELGHRNNILKCHLNGTKKR